MDQWYCFYLKAGVDSIMASYELERLGLKDIAVIEDPGVESVKILGRAHGDASAIDLGFIDKIESIPTQDVNWKDQWELFSPGFEDEKLTVLLSEYIPLEEDIPIYLHPGPGFGDLSHPSTQLTMQMMLPNVEGRIFIDVGCGSGILAVSAMKAGANRAYAIDIDSQAITHSKENALLNNVQEDISFFISMPNSTEVGKYPIAAMNMIASEQAMAWEAIKNLSFHQMDLFTSGVLALERERYLCEALERGWELQSEREKDGWLGFHFIHAP